MWRIAIASGGLCLGCQTVVPPQAPGQTPTPRTSGVALDPRMHEPEVREVADADAVTLLEPEPRGRVLSTLDRLFEAITLEDAEALRGVLSPDAEIIGARGSKTRALDYWARRWDKVQYSAQPSRLIYSPSDVTVATTRPGVSDVAAARGLLLRPGELLVDVPISPLMTSAKLFGSHVELALTQVAGEYKVRIIREDFELPESR